MTASIFRLPRRSSRPVRWCRPGDGGTRQATCPTCQGNGVVTGPVMTADAHAPGYAVVGGPDMASADAPGYAVVGGRRVGCRSGPDRCLEVRPGTAYGDPRMAAMGPRPARILRSLGRADVHSSGPGRVARPRAQDRPQIIGHVLGVPKFGAEAASGGGQRTRRSTRRSPTTSPSQGDRAAGLDGLRQRRPLISESRWVR